MLTDIAERCCRGSLVLEQKRCEIAVLLWMPKAFHFLAFCTHDSVFVRGKERITGIDDLIGITTAGAFSAELHWKSPGCHDVAGALPEDALNSVTFAAGMSHEVTGHGVQSASCSIFRPK